MLSFISRLRGSAATLLAAGALLASCSSPQKEDPPAAKPHRSALAIGHLTQYFNLQWAMDKLWEDGLAEVATYDAQRTIYKKKRAFELTQITVKEEFNQEFNVKTDEYKRTDLFPVMKVNQFCRIPTDQYPYHFLTSLFFRRDQPVELHKLTTSSQEWCGNTFKSIADDGVRFQQTYNSYWDGQGAGQRELRRDVLVEDALPYTLRTLKFDEKPAFDVTVLELQQTSQARPPVYYTAHVATTEAPAADAPQPAWRVAVVLDSAKQNVYWFAKQYPHILLRQTTWDGRSLRLKSTKRYAYWTH